jgi:hypothetical protein
MRLFSFLFHFLISLFLLAVGLLAWMSGNESVVLNMLPWKGATLNYILFFGGLVGVLLTLMAVRRVVPALFVLWNLVVLVMLVRGYFFSSYNFGFGGGSIGFALSLVVGALIALAGSLTLMRQGPRTERRKTALA